MQIDEWEDFWSQKSGAKEAIPHRRNSKQWTTCHNDLVFEAATSQMSRESESKRPDYARSKLTMRSVRWDWNQSFCNLLLLMHKQHHEGNQMQHRLFQRSTTTMTVPLILVHSWHCKPSWTHMNLYQCFMSSIKSFLIQRPHLRHQYLQISSIHCSVLCCICSIWFYCSNANLDPQMPIHQMCIDLAECSSTISQCDPVNPAWNSPVSVVWSKIMSLLRESFCGYSSIKVVLLSFLACSLFRSSAIVLSWDCARLWEPLMSPTKLVFLPPLIRLGALGRVYPWALPP